MSNSKDWKFRNGGISIWFYEQWLPFFVRKNNWNWYDFTWINFTHEWSPYKNSAEITFGLLGLNVGIVFWKKIEE